MSTPNIESTRGAVHTAFSLAHLLERIDRSSAPVDAVQYQVVVARLKAALSEALPDAALTAVLKAYPSAAELYENMNYPMSGLSRSPLESAVSSEVLAAQLLARLSRGSGSAGT